MDNCSNYVFPNYELGDYIDYNCRILFIVQIVYICFFNEWIGMSNSTNDKESYYKGRHQRNNISKQNHVVKNHMVIYHILL